MGFKIVFFRLSKVKLVKNAKFIAFLCLKMCPKLKTWFWCAQRSKTPFQRAAFCQAQVGFYKNGFFHTKFCTKCSNWQL